MRGATPPATREAWRLGGADERQRGGGWARSPLSASGRPLPPPRLSSRRTRSTSRPSVSSLRGLTDPRQAQHLERMIELRLGIDGGPSTKKSLTRTSDLPRRQPMLVARFALSSAVHARRGCCAEGELGGALARVLARARSRSRRAHSREVHEGASARGQAPRRARSEAQGRQSERVRGRRRARLFEPRSRARGEGGPSGVTVVDTTFHAGGGVVWKVIADRGETVEVESLPGSTWRRMVRGGHCYGGAATAPFVVRAHLRRKDAEAGPLPRGEGEVRRRHRIRSGR